jgi:lipopolysaccharide transport system ATP-binding protein
MTGAAIRAEGLGKKYLIGQTETNERYPTLRDAVMRKSGDFLRRAGDVLNGRQLVAGNKVEEFWALRNVAFEVQPGEVVGIIGKNGAGKSTLLKVLSRITEPSVGRVAVRGRVASLLEVGTGFHPELTGRENIYLNGSILGMSRADIRIRFDEIVAFAEIDKFLDTPVKRYSSGMYVRLAFAVAAHLEPDILVVDEVLAVGDAQFQKKCLGKMGEVANQHGRTVLLVSHQMAMVTSLCKRALLMNDGLITFDGTVAEAVARYYSDNGGSSFFVDFSKRQRLPGDKFARIHRAWIEDNKGDTVGEIDIRNSFKVKMVVEFKYRAPSALFPFMQFFTSQGQSAFTTRGSFTQESEKGIYLFACEVPGNLLNNDVYSVDLSVGYVQAGVHSGCHERGVLSVVISDPLDETIASPTRNGFAGDFSGCVRPELTWMSVPYNERATAPSGV